jgi:transketolase
MSALIPAHAIHVYTHDSIGLGEDGPTHQPVEHLASLRYIPNNQVWRPCDAVESAVAWKAAIERKGNPACLVFSRQNLKHQQRSEQQVAAIARGAYVLSDPADTKFKAILIATGSEVELAMEAARTLGQQGVPVRVVSMPCTEVFDEQPLEYREGVLPSWCRARVAVEAATADYWRKYVGLDGEVVGMISFGASAPAPQLFEHFGFTVSHVVDAVKRVAG